MRTIKKFFSYIIIFFKSIKEKIFSLLFGILSILLGVSSFQENLDKKFIIPYLIVMFIIYIIDVYKQGKDIIANEDKVSDLESQLSQQQYNNEMLSEAIEAIPEDFLELVYNELGFNSTERISLYTFRDEKFAIAARHAGVKPYNSDGRPEYPKDKGYIGKLWKSPDSDYTYYRCDLPSFENNKRKYIKKVNEETGLDEKTINELTMHSRCYYGKIIRSGNKPVGILMLESTKRRFDKTRDEITSILNGMSGKHLVSLLKVNEMANGKGK
ncbi:hypothetical protein [Enterococcus casseliflavus]|uniref:hypothetical protein n=1 Tax=Enterococcus casseliflavus TaxID=37734 RepID=UPI001CD21BAB|nr:hypothetical protein [Enterococcus casseliflavus]